MPRRMRNCLRVAVVLAAAGLYPGVARAHPGSGIAVDRLGQIYFVDTGSGLWKIDVRGVLTRIEAPRFHWMAIDADDRFGKSRLPTGAAGDIVRVSTTPTLLLASDYPIAMGVGGSLYYPTHDSRLPLQILQLTPSGQTTSLATLPAATPGAPLRDVNGLAVGPDGAVYYTEHDAIRRISLQGRVSTIAAGITVAGCAPMPGAGANDGPYLRGLAVDSAGGIYVAATGCGSLLKVAPDRQITKVLQLTSPWSPTAVALFHGDVLVLEHLQTASEDRRAWLPRVRRISPDGKSAVIASVDRR